SSVTLAIIEFEGANHSMYVISFKKWRYAGWTPSTIGVYPYKIWFQYDNGLWDHVNESIQVIDSTPPEIYDLVVDSSISEIGDPISISITIVDPSGIKVVLLEFENYNYSMSNIGDNKWQYDSLTPNKTGVYYYKIYIQDNENNWREVVGSFSYFISDSGMSGFIFSPVLLTIIISLVVIFGIVGGVELYQNVQSTPRTVQSNLKKISKYNKQIKANVGPFLDDRTRLKEIAKSAEDIGDYTRAAEIYRKCRMITIKMIKSKNKSEELNLEIFKHLEHEALFIDSIMSITMKCINDIISRHSIENGINYYINPILHTDRSLRPHGLILNETYFLQKRLINPINGEDLIKELDIDPLSMNKIKACQLVFTNSFSIDNLRSIAEKFQMDDVMLFIICLKWPNFQYVRHLELPVDVSINVRKNTRIINTQLFTELMDFNKTYTDKFETILKLNKDRNVTLLNSIFKYRSSFSLKTYDLISDLKRANLIQDDLDEYFNNNID
ncbi:MAG: hypothetical protein ACFFAT_15650, partial [Promethearchaeota archaeon]